MNIEQFVRYTGEMFGRLQDTKIVFLEDDSEILKFMNDGTIPVFENSGELQARTRKEVDGKECMVRRPYLICYNRELNCNIAYLLTGGNTREKIKTKMYHELVETPACFYDYIDSSVKGGLDKDTHSADNISTVSTIRAIPIPMCIADESQIHKVDFDGRNIPSSDIPVLRDFMSNFYGREKEKFITIATKSGRAYDWFIDFGDKISYHRMSRPSVSYIALFLNYAQSELENPKTTDPLTLSQLKGLTVGATEAFLNHQRFIEELDSVKRLYPYVFREFMQVRNDAVKHISMLGYDRAVMEEYSKSSLKGAELRKLSDLLAREKETSTSLSLVVNSVATYFNGQSKKINMSNIPMNKSYFETLSKIASTPSDTRFKAVLSKWCQNAEERFDIKIASAEAMIAERNLQRESEERRRLKEREARQEISRSRTERIKVAVQDAITLYNQFYKDSFGRLTDGTLVNSDVQENARDFIKLFSTYNDGSSLSLSRLIGSVSEDRTAQKYLADRIVGMSSFLSVIENSRHIITDSKKVKAMQKYIKSKSSRINAPEGIEIESAIDLMGIVHEEFSKASNLRRGKNDKSPVEIIIEKALREKDRFANVDFSTDSVARSYFDEMLTVSELYSQLESVTDIFEMRVEALWAMQIIKEDHEDLVEDYQIVCEKLNGIFAESMQKVLEPKTDDEFITNAENTIMGFINDKNLSAKDTIKSIKEYKKSVIEQANKERMALLEFVEVCNESVIAYNDYVVKYNEDRVNLEKMVSNAKQQVGYKQSEGFLEGVVTGRKVDVVKDLETGEEKIESADEEVRALCDEDLALQIFGRTIPQPGDIEDITTKRISKTNNVFEIISELKHLTKISKKWTEELNSSYDAVRRLYLQLLMYKRKIQETKRKMDESVNYFIDNLPQILTGGPIHLLSPKEAEEFVKYAKMSKDDALALIQNYYEDYALMEFVSGVIDYFNTIEVRSDANVPAYDYVNIGRITDGIILSYPNGVQKGVIDAISSDYTSICEFEKVLRTCDIEQMVANPEFDNVFAVYTPMLELESEIKLFEISTEVKHVVTDEERETEIQRRLIMSRVVTHLFQYNTQGFAQTDGLYEQLLARIEDLKRVAKREIIRAKNAQMMSERDIDTLIKSIPKTYDPMSSHCDKKVVKGLLKNAETAYNAYLNWLNRLQYIEKAREASGRYVKRSQSDQDDAKKILEGTIDDLF